VVNIKKFAHLYAKEKLSDDEAIYARKVQCAREIYNVRAFLCDVMGYVHTQ